MINVWCVRADGGLFADHFMQGGYAGIGWEKVARNLSEISSKEELVDLLVEHWNDIPEDFRDQLGLRPGLVRA
ncbi:MAG: hypothetical protein SGI88_08665 [Candidatus Hydrogenedentes bacterium]|nr:hypothetical protein [Candidatus Hydrogenedentota bacterium]